MPVVKLTAAFVRTATALPGTKRTTFWDRDLPSFGLQATSTGHKSYVLQYRAGRGRAGIDRRMTIDGRLALEDARREASWGESPETKTRCSSAAMKRNGQPAPSKLFARTICAANAEWSAMTTVR